MTGLQIKKAVTLSLTADQWELYTHRPGAAEAASALNTAVAEAVNSSNTALEAWKAIDASGVFERYADLGAQDSEPMYHLERIVEKVFGS